MTVLTPRQQQALALGHHLSVTANAGSGKTRVLVERYLEIIRQGLATPREAVVLTFTDKAASELRSRIARALQAAIEATPSAGRRTGLEQARGDLSGAWIGTIHSFCARLLREHPVEAGVDAAFGVVEGLDQRLLLRESVRAAFARLLRPRPHGEGQEELTQTVRRLGRSLTLRIVTEVVERRETWERWFDEGGLYRLPDTTIIGRWEESVDRFVDSALGSGTVREDLDRCARLADGKDAPRLRELHERFRVSGDRPERIGLFIEMLELALTVGGEPTRRVAGNAHEDLRAPARRLLRWRKDLRPLLSRGVAEADSHGALLAASRSVLAVAGEAVAIYTARKQESGQLDFEDLQLSTRRLLREPAVAEAIATRFRYILVDEYQDTNTLQYEILRPLVADLTSGNLFIVGDPKQSIYRFRNASVAVFQQTRRDLAAVSGPEAEIVLEESFRPLRELVAFVNLVFGRTMGSPDEDLSPLTTMEVRYDPLVQARAALGDGRVELLLMDPDTEGDAAEAGCLARRILRLQASRHTITGNDDRERPVRFGDIAVLLRTRTVLPEVEQALAHLGIPYIVSAGTGYFQTQDVLDLYNSLRVLEYPSDDAALVGTLRSPLFGVSDAELLEECRERRGGSLWHHLRSRVAGLQPGPLSRAIHALEDLRHEAERLTVPELLARLVSRTMYESKLHAMPGGEQARANLEKLRALARRAHVPGYLTLHDFLHRLRQLIDQEEHEGQGAVDLSGDAVQVMTVHAAKGLEFPVVAVPFLHRAFRLDHEPFIDEYLGLGFSMEGISKPPVAVLSQELNRRRTLAEEKRIAYVACTRGRDVLLLSGNPDGVRGKETVLSWMLEALDLDADTPSGIVEREVELGTLSRDGEVFTRGTVRHRHRLVVERPADLPDGRRAARERPAPEARPRVLSGRVESPPVQQFLSATRLRTYRECPRLYYLKYVLGYPGLSTAPIRPDQDEMSEARLDPGGFGRAFHAVMESVDDLGEDPEQIRAEAARTLALEPELPPHDIPARAEELLRAVLGILRSESWREIARGSDAQTEFTISAPLGRDYMVGTMDRIYRDDRGLWNLVDYKTDRVAADAVGARAEDYLAQIQFYAVLLAKYFDVRTVRATLLFVSAPDRPVTRVFGDADLREIEELILQDFGRITRGDFPAVSPPCPGCPFPPGQCSGHPSR